MKRMIFLTVLCVGTSLSQPALASGVPTVDVLAAQAINASRLFLGSLQAKLANGQVQADSELAKREQQADVVKASILSVEGCYTSTSALATAGAEKKSAAVAVQAESWMLEQARDAFNDEPYGYEHRIHAREEGLKDKDLQPVDLVIEQASLSPKEMKVALESLNAATSPRNADFGDVDEDVDARVRKIRHAWVTGPAVKALSQQTEAVDADEWRKTMAAMGHISEDAFANSDQMSLVEIFDFLVKARYGGAGYYSKTLASMQTPEELQRETIRILSMTLRLNLESLQLQRAQAMADAVSQSREFTSQFGIPVAVQDQ